MHAASGATFLMLPLIEGNDRVDHVLAVEDYDLEDAPVLLHALHGGIRHFSQIIHSLSQIVLTARAHGEIDYASRRWFQVIGLPMSAVSIAESVRKAAGPHRGVFERQWKAGVDSASAFSFEIPLATIHGLRWYELRAVPSHEGSRLLKWIVTIDDIHERVEGRHEIAAAHKRLEVLADVGAVLLDASLRPEEIVRRSLAAASGALDEIWIASFESSGRRNVVVHPAEARMFERAIDGIGETSGTTALMRAWNDEDPRPVLRSPLHLGDSGTHGLALVGAPGRAAFDAPDVNLFSEVAWRISVALRNHIAYERDSRIARVLQTAMLPVALPQPPGVSFDVAYRAAETESLVGGDWYDAFDLFDGRVAISIGDVAGHGLDASIVMGHVREMVRVYAMQGLSPGDVLAETNRAVVAGDHGLVTAFLGYLDPMTLLVEYASAGHLPPLLVSSGGTVEELDLGDIILGALYDAPYQTKVRQLNEGSAVVLYTDGLVEYDRDALAGESRFREVLSEWGQAGFSSSAGDLSDRAIAGARVPDDIAVLIVRTTPQAHIDATLPGSIPSSRRARVAIGRVLAGASLGERGNDFLLAMCEAINNAIEHGSRSSRDAVRFCVECDENGGVTGVVESRGQWKENAPSVDRGRGFTLMNALADRVTVNAGRHGTTVRLVLYPKSVPQTASLA